MGMEICFFGKQHGKGVFPREGGHGKREEGMHSMMVVLLVILHKDDRFIHLVLTVAASVVARDGMDGD